VRDARWRTAALHRQQVEDGRVSYLLGELVGAPERAARIALDSPQSVEMRPSGCARYRGRCEVRSPRCGRIGLRDQQRLVVIDRKPRLPLCVGDVLAPFQRLAQRWKPFSEVRIFGEDSLCRSGLRRRTGHVADKMRGLPPGDIGTRLRSEGLTWDPFRSAGPVWDPPRPEGLDMGPIPLGNAGMGPAPLGREVVHGDPILRHKLPLATLAGARSLGEPLKPSSQEILECHGRHEAQSPSVRRSGLREDDNRAPVAGERDAMRAPLAGNLSDAHRFLSQHVAHLVELIAGVARLAANVGAVATLLGMLDTGPLCPWWPHPSESLVRPTYARLSLSRHCNWGHHGFLEQLVRRRRHRELAEPYQRHEDARIRHRG
jgi:hypothetical protein